MYRRDALCVGGAATAALLAGCVGGDGNGDDTENGNGDDTGGNGDETENGDEAGPLYSEDDHEEMLLSVEDFPEGWERNDDINEHFDAVFANEDESIIVLIMVEIEETVEDAIDNFEQSRSGTRDPMDYDIGDEAFWDSRDDELAVTLFRHSNAVGQAGAIRESGLELVPDEQRSQKYAEDMFDGWSDVSE